MSLRLEILNDGLKLTNLEFCCDICHYFIVLTSKLYLNEPPYVIKAISNLATRARTQLHVSGF